MPPWLLSGAAPEVKKIELLEGLLERTLLYKGC